MERQSGLGRSLEDVLDSLAPTDPDPAAPGRVLFEPEALEQQLDSLMGDIRDLRERVHHLVALVPETADEPPAKRPPKEPHRDERKASKKQARKKARRKAEKKAAKKALKKALAKEARKRAKQDRAPDARAA